uniref:ATP-dependent DNA helicase n=1 Tax=Mycena chlorophos TaxID=658473 RepID=A0ABQ0KUC0_MYCCL|nr:predicted protein [Mycena chlorophos]
MDQALRSYTLAEAFQLLDTLCQVPASAKRTWKTLLAYLDRLEPELQDKIKTAAAASSGSKRKAVFSQTSRPKRRKLEDDTGRVEGYTGDFDVLALVNGPFLACTSNAVRENCTAKFIDKTNNAALKKEICVVCARSLFSKFLERIQFHELPNQTKLRPSHPHAAHKLVEGILLYGDPDPNNLIWVCKQCLTSLKKCELPKLALANNMWIGEIPFELRVLTLPEQLLISIYYPAAYIIKVYPKKNAAHTSAGEDSNGKRPPPANEKLRGNVSSFRLPSSQIADMVAGNMVPRPTLLLAAVIGVTFVGVGKAAMSIVPGICRVRRQHVFDALMWLKTHNRLYENMVISQENLRALPEDDVPREILDNIRMSESADAAFHEEAGYVPEDEDDEEATDSEDDMVDVQPDTIGEADRDDSEDAVRHMDVDPETSEEPMVFPLKPHGVIDVGGDNIPETTLFAHAVENAIPETYASDYGIRKGRAFVSEYARTDENRERFDGGPTNPNHLLGAFPMLFPYGYGGFEVDRDVKVTYEAHVQWALQYADRRFRKHTQFSFQTFGVLWKRQVCQSTSVHMDRNEYLAHQTLISKLEPRDLILASEEENRKVPISNPTVRLLRKHLTTIRARVQGTDESRVGIRAQIWGLTLRFNPPSLWMTINLSDTSDPIAQVLAGQAIDLDLFAAKMGPNSTSRTRTIAEDPFAASEYFHLVVRLVLEEMLGMVVSARGAITRREGVLGRINAYIGTVEAQARGSLHLHLLLWLDGAPTASQMQEALKSEEFREKIRRFIHQNIRADVPGSIAAPATRKKLKRSIAFSRPVDPRNGQFTERMQEKERVNAPVLQSHKCNVFYCLKTCKGKIKCKRGYPWPTYEMDWVDEDGNWGAKRRFPFINPWNPSIFNVTRSNMDIKLLTNSWETKDIAFYITLYIAKKQVQAANTSAILADSYAFKHDTASEPTALEVGEEDEAKKSIKTINKKLFAQCANTLSRQYELSGPEVMGYLMGWGDRYLSHTFVKIYWDPIVATLHRTYPSLKRNLFEANIVSSEETSSSNHVNPSSTVPLTFEEGKFVLQDQLQQYADRGDALKDKNLYDYLLDTYHDPYFDPDSQENESDDDTSVHPQRAGRPSKTRIPYVSASGRKGARVVRSSKQETALHIIGRWLPNRNDQNQENYSAQILVLLKPWRNLSDIKNTFDSFLAAREHFESQCDSRVTRIMENVQYFHECSESARRRRGDHNSMESEFDVEADQDEAGTTGGPNAELVIDEEDILEARRTKQSSAEQAYGAQALKIAQQYGIFLPEGNRPVEEKLAANKATEEEELEYKQWGAAVATICRNTNFVRDATQVVVPQDSGTVTTNPALPTADDLEGNVNVISNEDTRQRSDVQQRALDILNLEQRRAHNIIEQHLARLLKGQDQAQLLMIVQGEGGTGKTVLLNAVAHTFDFYASTSLLAKTGTTGISASLIGGQTLHQWAGIPIRGSENSNWVSSEK